MPRALVVHPENPLRLDFMFDTGTSGIAVTSPEFRGQAQDLIKYFLAALTIKEDDLWVNLSPYERSRIAPDDLSRTALGRDMLAQDYVLKQLTASMIYPESRLGKAFWSALYTKAARGQEGVEVPVHTYNKVWIVADKARVLERGHTAYVVGAHLKVMLEEDYLARERNAGTGRGAFASAQNSSKASGIVRRLILPELEAEVNAGKNFGVLRQAFYAMILASWYKKRLKAALLNQVYSDKAKTGGIQTDSPGAREQIYAQYLEAYKKGVFNYIKDQPAGSGGPAVPRKYFSGGLRLHVAEALEVTSRPAPGDGKPAGDVAMVAAWLNRATEGTGARDFIERVENPVLTNMRARLQRARRAAPGQISNAIVEALSHPEHVERQWTDVFPRMGRMVFVSRVRNNTLAGPAKGGNRYVTGKDLMDSPGFEEVWKKFLAMNPSRDDVRRLIARWIGQDAQALALGMTLKNAGIGLDLGGGKGVVFIGRIRRVKGAWTIDDYPDWKSSAFLARVARAHSRALARRAAVGIHIDIPAPDMRTNGRNMAWYEDEYLQYVAFETPQIKTAVPELQATFDRIRRAAQHPPVTATPYLDAAVRYWLAHPGTPVPWLGVYTGKPVRDEDTGIFKGGVLGRVEATGEGVADLIEAALGERLAGMTVAIQGLGNVAQPIPLRLIRRGARVMVISDAGGTYISRTEAGFSLAELAPLVKWLGEDNTRLIKDSPEGVFARREVKAVEGNPEDMRAAVLEADVDILIPAALESQITEHNAARIRAKHIFEAANNPITPAAADALHRKGIEVYPDTLANSGGVFVSSLETQQAVTGYPMSIDEVNAMRRNAIVRAYDALLAVRRDHPQLTLKEALDIVALRRLANLLPDGNLRSGSSTAVPLPAAADNAMTAPGGIDLNARNMTLDVDDAGGAPVAPLTPAVAAGLRRGEFAGLVPIILRITEVRRRSP